MRFALRSFVLAAPLLSLTLASSSFAQTAITQTVHAQAAAGVKKGPAGTPAKPATTVLAPPSASAVPETPIPGPSPVPIEIPPAPTVNDPMLAPVPPPTQMVGSWEEALSLVRSRNTDLKTAYDEVLRAEAQERVALAASLTQINANVSYSRSLLFKNSSEISLGTQTINTGNAPTRSPNIDDILTASLNVTQPIIALRAWHTIGTTRVAERAAKLSVDDLKRNIALGVANALVGVVTAERIAELNRIGFRSALERLDLTQRKRNLGAANGLDVVRAQQDVESSRSTLVTGDESLRQARESLGLALGYPTQIGVSPSININGLEADAQQACHVAPVIEDRSDLLVAKTKAEIAKRNIDDVKYQFAPTLNATSSVGLSSLAQAGPNPTWNIGAVLSIPLWEGGARYGSLHDNQAQYDEAQQNYESIRRQALVQVEQAKRNVKVAEDSRKVAADARALAAELDRLTQTAYREGQGTSLELVVAASALRQAEVNLALQEFTVVKARVLAILSLATCPW